ncbi:hypothetical protein [Pricia sp.]|uniref:cupredoxin domain-containing protein n=1 Tax=Pricia sp. TaxID=2268138 RepID=UPI003592F0CE
MKSLVKSLRILPIFAGIFFVASCSNDDGTVTPPEEPEMEEPVTETDSKTYDLGPVSNPDILGTAKFITFSNDSTVIELNLEGTTDGNMHPAHIHFNTAVEGGDIALDLTAVDGATGESSTPVTELNDGAAISYAQLLEYDGYINVHLSTEDLGTLVAQGDIGQNELTDTSKEYALGSVSDPDINGTATFTKRVNGEALAVLALNNTAEDAEHPAHIHINTAAEGGAIVFDFIPVNGETGLSMTNVAEFNDGTPFLYDDLLEYDGYINVHFSLEDLGTLVAQGDIGQNELTGESVDYDLAAVSNPAIFGKANFAERVNGETLVSIDVEGTTAGNMHPSHIHIGSVEDAPGAIIVSLGDVNGETGTSVKNVTALNGVDGTSNAGDPLDYAAMIAIDGYINVHLSMEDLATLIAQGNVGANAGDDDGEEDAEVVNYDVTNVGVTAYIFNSDGLENIENPDLTLKRGQTYTFTVNASGHPFYIKSVQGNTNTDAYSTGVTNNGTQDGTVTFEVPMDAPDTLYYNCQFHAVMTGVITITD